MRGVVTNGKKIIALRKAAGLTQEMLSAESGCDTKTIRSAERGKRVDLATLRRIAVRLAVDFREFVADGPPESRQANIEAAERYIRAFNARDPEAVAACFCEDGVVITLADPALPGSGEFRGREQVRRWGAICFATYRAEAITPDMYRADAVGNLVFVQVEQPLLQYLASGKQATVSLISEFRIADGLIATLRTYPESGAIERMVFESKPAASG